MPANFGTANFQRVVGIPQGGGGTLSPIPRPSPAPRPAPMQPIRTPPSGTAIPTGASTGVPVRSIGPAYSGPTGLSPSSPIASQFTQSAPSGGVGSGSFDTSSGAPTAMAGVSSLSGVPWYVWALVGLAVFFVLAQPRELHIKA